MNPLQNAFERAVEDGAVVSLYLRTGSKPKRGKAHSVEGDYAETTLVLQDTKTAEWAYVLLSDVNALSFHKPSTRGHNPSGERRTKPTQERAALPAASEGEPMPTEEDFAAARSGEGEQSEPLPVSGNLPGIDDEEIVHAEPDEKLDDEGPWPG